MKTHKVQIGFITLLTVLAIAFLASLFSERPNIANGSVAQGSDLHSTMATSGLASASVSQAFTAQTLGSVVVTTAPSAGVLRIWDATSTATSTYQNESNTSTTTTYGRLVAQFPTTAAAQTYTFDAVLYKGLVVEVPTGWNGIATVTYR